MFATVGENFLLAALVKIAVGVWAVLLLLGVAWDHELDKCGPRACYVALWFFSGRVWRLQVEVQPYFLYRRSQPFGLKLWLNSLGPVPRTQPKAASPSRPQKQARASFVALALVSLSCLGGVSEV